MSRNYHQREKLDCESGLSILFFPDYSTKNTRQQTKKTEDEKFGFEGRDVQGVDHKKGKQEKRA